MKYVSPKHRQECLCHLYPLFTIHYSLPYSYLSAIVGLTDEAQAAVELLFSQGIHRIYP